ncbi:MAG: class I SAM-dependent methyltransferase [Actinomycetota bacterium]
MSETMLGQPPIPGRLDLGRRPLDRSVELLYDSSFVDRYDVAAEIWERCFCRHALRTFHDRLCRLPRRPLRVLDLGCGTGRNLHRLAQAGVAIDHYTGVDRSGRMLRRARRNHPYARVEFVAGEAMDAAVSARDYDLVLATWLLSHQPAPEVLLDAARGSLAADGRLLVLALTSTDNVVGRLHGWRFHRFLQATPIDPAVLARTSPSHLSVSGSGLISCADIGTNKKGSRPDENPGVVERSCSPARPLGGSLTTGGAIAGRVSER